MEQRLIPWPAAHLDSQDGSNEPRMIVAICGLTGLTWPTISRQDRMEVSPAVALGLSTREGQTVANYSIVFSERLGSSDRNQGIGCRTSLWHLTVYLPKPSYDVFALWVSPKPLMLSEALEGKMGRKKVTGYEEGSSAAQCWTVHPGSGRN